MNKRRRFNAKRRIQENAWSAEQLEALADLARYTGNPEHKNQPGDFGLTPPVEPCVDKSKCDLAGVSSRTHALTLLRAGVRRGLVSALRRGAFPHMIWAVDEASGQPFEARLEQEESGDYHGYPLLENDPFRDKVLEVWNRQA